jgi:type II secretory pathway predicted ATPase ExeA
MNAPRYVAHFELGEPPFDKDIADQDLWVPSSRLRLVDAVVDAIHERAHVLLVGEPGIGKTCVLRAVRHRLQAHDAAVRLTYCHNATLGRRDFYRHICQALGLAPKATAAAVFFAIQEHVRQLGEERIHPALLLDEAHLIQQDVLDHLHILSNYEWDRRPLLSLVLVGLPELRRRLQLTHNRSLYSRIHTRLSLGDPRPADTTEYVTHRLARAGCPRELFGSDALAMLHEASHGRPRDIDRIATCCLKLAARRKLRVIDRALIERAVDDDAPLDEV